MNWKVTQMKKTKSTPVNPNHYKQGTTECFDVMRLIFGDLAIANFCRVNAFKYIWRCKDKNGLEDLEKAKWYLERARGLDSMDSSNKDDLLDEMVGKAMQKLEVEHE